MVLKKEESVWEDILKTLKIAIKKYREFSNKFNPLFLQNIQLSFIYFFAFIDLVYSILQNVFALGAMPEAIRPVFPLIKFLLQSPFFRILASPERTFLLSYLVLEFMITRETFRFSKLVRYNILLVFSLLMIQGIVISYWDTLFNREIIASMSKWTIDQGAIVGTDRQIAILLFFLTFMVFVFLYIYLYIRALKGYFFTSPGCYWLTDSVSFWLKIRTPTMRFGEKKE